MCVIYASCRQSQIECSNSAFIGLIQPVGVFGLNKLATLTLEVAYIVFSQYLSDEDKFYCIFADQACFGSAHSVIATHVIGWSLLQSALFELAIYR